MGGEAQRGPEQSQLPPEALGSREGLREGGGAGASLVLWPQRQVEQFTGAPTPGAVCTQVGT